MTDPKIVLGRILQRMIDQGYSQVKGYNQFGLVSFDDVKVVVSREDGEDTPIYFKKMIEIIEKYQHHPADYDLGPNALRDHGITRIKSPVWSMLHLLEKRDYKT